MSYEFIYKLKPVREYEPGWWKLAWKPIKMGTWNLYIHKLYSRSMMACRALGFHMCWGGTFNGWGRSWHRLDIRLSIWFWEINFWVIWKIHVMAEGPMDQNPPRPLDLSRVPTYLVRKKG